MGSMALQTLSHVRLSSHAANARRSSICSSRHMGQRSIICRPVRAQNGDGENPEPSADERLLTAITGVGLSGSIAVGGASLIGLQPSLYEQFNWSNTNDFIIAFAVNSLVMSLEALLFFPSYSDALRRRPGASQQQQSSETPSSSSSSISTNDRKRASSKPIGTFNEKFSGVDWEASSKAWSLEGWLAVLALNQACYTATQAALKPPGPIYQDLGLMLMTETARELLQRGFAMTFLAAWLADRVFEAGAEDSYIVSGYLWYTPDICK